MPETMLLQELLNRGGALLDTDGLFGKATKAAVQEFQSRVDLPVTGVANAATWAALRKLKEPSRSIPCKAVTFICREEVGSRKYYDTKCACPIRPGFESGVTIGVGYDLGYQTEFERDWGKVLTAEHLAALRPWLGKKGKVADPAIPLLAHVVIPWEAAWSVFLKRTLPQEIARTRKAFKRPRKMSALSFGALVSLIYNRGTGMKDPPTEPGKRLEMREIRDALAVGDLGAVPAALRRMKRHWPGTALADRREREAQLFEEGM
jgi:hypothetical protein